MPRHVRFIACVPVRRLSGGGSAQLIAIDHLLLAWFYPSDSLRWTLREA
jgi:hypothetical protein